MLNCFLYCSQLDSALGEMCVLGCRRCWIHLDILNVGLHRERLLGSVECLKKRERMHDTWPHFDPDMYTVKSLSCCVYLDHQVALETSRHGLNTVTMIMTAILSHKLQCNLSSTTSDHYLRVCYSVLLHAMAISFRAYLLRSIFLLCGLGSALCRLLLWTCRLHLIQRHVTYIHTYMLESNSFSLDSALMLTRKPIVR